MNIARSRQTTTTVIIWTATNIRRTLLVKFVKHNQNYYLKLDVSTSIRGLHQKKLVLSSSGSWHDGKTPYQESGRMRGLVGSCPHHGSRPIVFPFGSVWPFCIFIRFDRIHERDGRTDRRTNNARQLRPRLCIAWRGKSVWYVSLIFVRTSVTCNDVPVWEVPLTAKCFADTAGDITLYETFLAVRSSPVTLKQAPTQYQYLLSASDAL